MNRLEQDAADELDGYEQQRVWRERALADRDRAMQPAPTKVWAPVMTDQQKQEFQQYSQKFNLPF